MSPTLREAAKAIARDALAATDEVEISAVIDRFVAAPEQRSVKSALLTHYDSVQEAVIGLVKAKLAQDKENGLTPRFAFSGVAPDVLIRLRDPTFDFAVTEMSAAVGELSWRSFEHFSRHVLRINGVQPCSVLRGTKEEGIDICGLMDLSREMKSAIWKDASLRVLGQVKKTRVGQRDIRLFHTDLSSCSNGQGEGFRLAPGWFQESKAPVLGFVFGFSGFTRTAQDWARLHGILTKDLRHMVEDILNRQTETPGVLRIGETAQFQKEVFLRHFAALK